MKDVIFDTLTDALKLLPFLFLTYLLLEFLEHKMGEHTEKLIHRSGKFGPFFGALCGCVPQCGFSAAASNFYAGRVITLGTLISIYLSTSDEMLPVMLSQGVSVRIILSVIAIKVVYGLIIGFIIDIVYRKNESPKISEMCEHQHCHCDGDNGIIKPAVRHTLEILLFIVLISFALNTIIFFIGEDNIKSVISDKALIGELACGLVGLIPNCAASVVVTELYISGLLSFGALMSGLFVGAGVGLIVLFRVNKSFKENAVIVALLYASGVLGGILINLFGITV